MGFDYPAMKFWWDVFITICLVSIAIYSWIKGRHAANAQDIDRVREWVRTELDIVDGHHQTLRDRVAKVEGELAHVPTHDQIAKLAAQLGNLHGDLSKAIGGLEAMTHQMALVQKHLLRNPNGGG